MLPTTRIAAMQEAEWRDYAHAVRSLPDEAKNRLRSAPVEKWLSAETAKGRWHRRGRY